MTDTVTIKAEKIRELYEYISPFAGADNVRAKLKALAPSAFEPEYRPAPGEVFKEELRGAIGIFVPKIGNNSLWKFISINEKGSTAFIGIGEFFKPSQDFKYTKVADSLEEFFEKKNKGEL